MTRPLALIAAIAENGVIGRDNRLIWRIRSDLRRFRDLTWGKPMIVGRKTYESIGKPLPGRETIVVTRARSFAEPGVQVAHDIDEAIARADEIAERLGAAEIAVAGGAEIYRQTLPRAQRLYLTFVHAEPEGDVLFPSFDRSEFRETRREYRPKGPDDDHAFTIVDLERRRPSAAGR
jgi:dihydrofolate reductase